MVIDSYKCEIENYDTSNISDTKKAIVLRPNSCQIPIETSNEYHDIKLLETDNSLPIHALKFSRSSTSNVGNSVRIYDANWNHLKTLNNPVNKYQANNRRGLEYDVVGLFKSGNNWYIEILRSLGGECNACIQYVVDTYKITDSGELVEINSRDFDIVDYKNIKEDFSYQ